MTRPCLINRVPEPGDVAVLVNADIEIDITDTGGGTVNESATQVYVGGALAFDGGVFQAGFTGANSASSNPQPETLRVIIDPTNPLLGGTTYTVRVVSQITGSPGLAIDQSYSFSTEDLSGPELADVFAVDLDVIRVVASEPLRATDATTTGDALNPESWTLELVTDETQPRPIAVTASVASVEKVTADTFELRTDIELTHSALYRLTTTARDTVGNFALAPGNTTTFLGYLPPQPDGRAFDLLEWVADQNLREDDTGDLERWIAVVQEPFELLLFLMDRFADMLDPDTAPERVLDAMLLDLGYPFSFDLEIVDKRRLIKILRAMYQQKGTDRGIINAIRFFLGIEVTITTPYLSGAFLGVATLGGTFVLTSSALADVYTFWIHVPRVLVGDEERRINEIADFMKRAPCHHVILAPSVPAAPDHWELGLSRLGTETILH